MAHQSGGVLSKKAQAKADTEKALRVVALVIGEFISTEKGYVADLATLCHAFLEPIAEAAATGQAVCSAEVQSVAFGQLNILLPLNEQLLAALERGAPDDAAAVAQTFISFAPYFKMYSAYINNYVRAQELVDGELTKNKRFIGFCAESKRAPHALQSLLIKPVQRIPRYKLLLGELHKRAGKAGAKPKTLAMLDRASDAISVVAMACNDQVSAKLQNMHVVELHRQFRGAAAPRHVARRKLLKEGLVATMNRRLKPKSRLLVLFNDCLLYCGREEGKLHGMLFNRGVGSIEVSTVIPTATLYAKRLDIMSAPDGEWDTHEREQLAYAFIVSSPQRSFVVAAEDPEERDAWINAMRDAAQEQWAYEFEVCGDGEKGALRPTPSAASVSSTDTSFPLSLSHTRTPLSLRLLFFSLSLSSSLLLLSLSLSSSLLLIFLSLSLSLSHSPAQRAHRRSGERSCGARSDGGEETRIRQSLVLAPEETCGEEEEAESWGRRRGAAPHQRRGLRLRAESVSCRARGRNARRGRCARGVHRRRRTCGGRRRQRW